jgi:hypothetical protein
MQERRSRLGLNRFRGGEIHEKVKGVQKACKIYRVEKGAAQELCDLAEHVLFFSFRTFTRRDVESN